MLTRVLLCMLFSAPLLAQVNTVFKQPCYAPDLYSGKEMHMLVTADTPEEQRILHKADSALIAALKYYKATDTNYAATYFYVGFCYGQIGYSEMEKYFDREPLNEYHLQAMWNETFDTLYMWSLANLYWDKHDTLEGKYAPLTIPLYSYSSFMNYTDYEALRDLAAAKIRKELGISYNDDEAVWYATEKFPIDTTILPQVDNHFFSTYILNTLQYNIILPFKDPFLNVEYAKVCDHCIPKEPVDTTKYYKPGKVLITEEWTFTNEPTQPRFNQAKYQYAFMATRKKLSIGIEQVWGPDNSMYVPYDNFKRETSRNNTRPDIFWLYHQVIEAVMFKKYQVYNAY